MNVVCEFPVPPGVPETVIGYAPAGVEAPVAIVSVVVQFGVHGLFENVAVAPAGRPVAV